MKIFVFILPLISCTFYSIAQVKNGITLDAKTKIPIDYVNIGVIKKNKGTLSDFQGQFQFSLDGLKANDTILFSRIGYSPFKISVKEFLSNTNNNVFLKEESIGLNEIEVISKKYKTKRLGKTIWPRISQISFHKNSPGAEFGTIIASEEEAFVEMLYLEVAKFTYDTLYNRINVYQTKGDTIIKNLLMEPIYIKIPKKDLTDKKLIEIDLRNYKVKVKGNFLITLEHLSDQYKGQLFLWSAMKGKTYFRYTSQGDWKKMDFGLSMYVTAKIVE